MAHDLQFCIQRVAWLAHTLRFLQHSEINLRKEINVTARTAIRAAAKTTIIIIIIKSIIWKAHVEVKRKEMQARKVATE